MDVTLDTARRIKILNSDDLYEVMRQILLREDKIDRNKEHFWTVGLDTSNAILYIELISMGGTNKAIVEPMQVFRVGILKGAVKMILVHNHPTGELKPSQQDKDVTDRLLQVGNILLIEILDHLIITEKTYMSFVDTGLLDQIKQSKKYIPDYQLKANLKKEVEQIVAEETIVKRNKEIARELKKKGISEEIISEVTGLTPQQIKKLK